MGGRRTLTVALCASVAVGTWAAPAVAQQAPPAPPDAVVTLTSVLVGSDERRLEVRLLATGPLEGALDVTTDEPRRIFVDLAGVGFEVARVIPVGRGVLQRIRVGLNSADPVVTRVVFDVDPLPAYRMEPGDSRRELRIILEPSPGREAPAEPPAPSVPDPDAAGRRSGATLATPASPTPPAEPTADRADGNKAYATWFDGRATRAGALLERSMRRSPELMAAGEWAVVERDVQAETPPAPLAAAHSLLLESVRLGRIAAALFAEPGRTAEANAAASGARMLLDRARQMVARQ